MPWQPGVTKQRVDRASRRPGHPILLSCQWAARLESGFPARVAPMPSFRLVAVILGHLAFAGASYAVWTLGQKFAPDLIGSEVVLYPMVIGIVGIWLWYWFWSA